jgi:hypothetical protein
MKKYRFFVCMLGLTATITGVFFGNYEFLIRAIASGCWGFMLAQHYGEMNNVAI